VCQISHADESNRHEKLFTSEVAGTLICETLKLYQTSVMYSEAVHVETIVFNAEMDRYIVQLFVHISY
jgi:hypothetical protein